MKYPIGFILCLIIYILTLFWHLSFDRANRDFKENINSI